MTLAHPDGAPASASAPRPAGSGEWTQTRELPAEDLHRLLAEVSRLPRLRHLYQGLAERPAGSVRLADLPVLTKEQISDALEDVVLQARGRGHGAYVYGSGGTTSAPRLSLVPTSMFVPEILRHWSPLSPRDVLVNFNTPGRLWSSHNFFNMLAHHSGAVTIPLGSVERHEMADWLDFVDRLGATALDATPSQIAHILEFCESTGRPLPGFRTLLWTGEAYGARAAEVTRRVMPDARLHGVYGSTETWVVGLNWPSCPVDTFHVLPYQHVEIVDGAVVVTNTHPERLNPILRYRVGDLGRLTTCACGRPDRALRLLGRDDPQLKFVSILLMPADIADAARSVEEVRDVQIALTRHGRPDEHMEVRILVRSGTDHADVERRVRDRVLTRVYRLGWAVASTPDSFAVRVVNQLVVNPRTHKTALVLKTDQGTSAHSAR
ncbi:phenylacetate--CoA ligase family protein [Allostreptomyces psammosilenae]|uniref:Phenylacetate-CoA ligase n=1 Tax=Allostreptomyces psammosilenae TaxID=1892865 RepID=A0A853A0G3_9ACTN|nr:AMP-binding protein [Allostreptomyces psammosilenae]NYI06950.1 phenylacetate-CoA ligase [Allostreptomyces psammosilenae]